MQSRRKFLVVDDNVDSRFLLVKTLLRKFPNATILEEHEGDVALAITKNEPFDALIVHRAAEIDGVSLIRMLRHANPTIPIVMVSGVDRAKEAVAAGATTFLNYDAWLRIGTVVTEIVLNQPSPTTPASSETTAPTNV